MKKNETELIDYNKQHECLQTAKEYFKIFKTLSLETILGIALIDNDIDKKPKQTLNEYYSYYNRENAEHFNINPTVMMFDDKYHESLFLNFLIDVSEVANKLQSSCKKINIIPNETTCDFIGNQFVSRNKCKTCINHVWSNYESVYCLKDSKTKTENKDE